MVWIGLAVLGLAVAAALCLLRFFAAPSALPAPAPSVALASPAAPSGSPVVAARFVGEIGEVGLPDAPVKVIPIGYDAHFVLPVRISRVIEGTLPLEGDLVTFLIHSPALFFADSLGELPPGNHPEGEFTFTLYATEWPEGTAYDLQMRPAEGATAGTRE